MNLRPFEVVLISVFGMLALGGLLFFSLFKPAPNPADKPYGDGVVIWGTLDKIGMTQALHKVAQSDKKFEAVTYVQKDARTFESDLITAIAQGQSPDLIILPHTSIVELRKVIALIKYDSLPERTFRDTYVDGAAIFASAEGIYGIPFAVDPMMMYWNRDMFSSAGLAIPPKTWESLVGQAVPALTKVNDKLNITQGAVAFGEYGNISHAKDILSMLFLQAGSSIVEERSSGYVITLGTSVAGGLPPGEAVLSFYTQFVSPSTATYSWNRSLPPDRSQFLGGTLALYFAPGSEFKSIQRENPNLNFDITTVPQGSGATTLRDYGTFYALAMLDASKNKTAAFNAARALSAEDQSDAVTTFLDLTPVSRAVLATGSSDSYRKVLYQEALVTRGWFDPAPKASGDAFRTMVEDVTGGRKSVTDSVHDTISRLQLLFKN